MVAKAVETSATVMSGPTVTEMHKNRNSDLGINTMHSAEGPFIYFISNLPGDNIFINQSL